MAEWTDSISSSEPLANTDEDSDQYVPSSILISSEKSSLRSSLHQNSSLYSLKPKHKKNTSLNDSSTHIDTSELRQSINSRIERNHHSDDEQQLINYNETKNAAMLLTPISSRSTSRTRKTKSDERSVKTANSPIRTITTSQQIPPAQPSKCCLLI